MAATEATKELTVWIKSVAEVVMNRSLTLPIWLYDDNNGAIALSTNLEIPPRTKHIDIRYRFVTQLVTSNTAIVRYIPTANLNADGFTRALCYLMVGI